ncbi:multiple epidermal growth factor-like domains protein 10 [Haliotis rubra]|uniref:multiple epidermal growth factor-like domains protein 10 n=1 Tax=Haliotis rubra TaxID=36100 RepID=UPI001EE4FFAC|nr:multiple epidermal growth factor-like domains protein 10 [Haliotis rubra]
MSQCFADTSAPVDGDNDIDGENRTCFHAATSPSDWTVDLGRDFQLYDIRIYSRSGYTLNNTTNTTTTNCSTLPSSSNTTTSQTDVTCNGTGRYVTIKNLGTGPGENDTLNICEVEIYVCSQNIYWKDCDSFCHCLNSTCDRWTGLCPGDCRPGWQGRDVTQVRRYCWQDWWVPVSGTRDCRPAWQGQRCDTACNNTTYGINCNETCTGRKCSAPNSLCDRHNGACDTGCLSGWTGADCTRAPISGTDHDFLNITLPLIVVSTVAGVLVVLVLALVVLLIRRRGKQKRVHETSPTLTSL